MDIHQMRDLLVRLKDKRHQLHSDFADGIIKWDEYDKKCNLANDQIDILESTILSLENIDDLISGG